MNRAFRGAFTALSISILLCGSVWAQGSTAQINGTVRDQTGAVLPGAEITVTQTETSVARNVLTDETGSFILPNLPTGPYRLEVGMPGFRTFVQTGIVLQVNANATVNPVLEVGQVSEQVEVQANAALVETRSQGVGQVIENERILELPLNGRQVTDLIVLAGGAVQTGTASSRSMQGGVGISVAGGMGFGVAYALDGAMHNNSWEGVNLPLPFPDALQEFKVETGGLTAQNGMRSAAAVNSVTKSGTNEFHGDVFEFVRNGMFNARNFFATKRDTLKRNQFGGTLGGPIKRNKLFFFAGYQGTKTREDPPTTISYVPTAAMLAGDFTAITSPACNAGRQIALRAPFVNNRIDPALFSRAAVNITSKLPKAQDECGKIQYGRRQAVDEMQAVGKIDFQLSDSHSIFGRYMATSYTFPPALTFAPDNVLVGTLGGRDNLAQSFTLGDTYLFGANTVLSLRYTGNREAIHRPHIGFFSPAEMGVKHYGYLEKYTLLSVTGGFSLGGGTESEATTHVATFQQATDLSVIRGAHQMGFGSNIAYFIGNFNANVQSPGNFNFNGQQIGLGMADFLAGRLNTLNQSVPNSYYPSRWYAGTYAQDTWKISQRLTLNFGLRWEPGFAIKVRDGQIYHFDYDLFTRGVRSPQYKNAPAGLVYPGDSGFPGLKGQNTNWWDITPRVGLAWDVQGDGRMSVRASYGMFVDRPNGQFHTNTVLSTPWGGRVTVTAPLGGFDDPWRDYPGGQPFPLDKKAGLYTQYSQFTTSPYDYKSINVQNWSLSIQRQLGADWLTSINYLGTLATHLITAAELNPAIYLPGGPCTLHGVTYNPCSTINNTNQRRRLAIERFQDGQYFGPIAGFEWNGVQNYHAMQLSLQRRATSGVTFSGNYTWSHCIGDDAGSTSGGQPGGSSFLVGTPRTAYRGNCTDSAEDHRHIFNSTVVAETPRFASTALRTVASGWRVSGIYRVSSGRYFTISTGVDSSLTGLGTGSQKVNQVLASPYGDKDNPSKYLNAFAFAQPANGTMGTMGRSNVLGPSNWQFDVALSRVFQVREGQRLEFRAEAFNLTNSYRAGTLPAAFSALNSNTFGQINVAADPRILQFALKYVF